MYIIYTANALRIAHTSPRVYLQRAALATVYQRETPLTKLSIKASETPFSVKLTHTQTLAVDERRKEKNQPLNGPVIDGRDSRSDDAKGTTLIFFLFTIRSCQFPHSVRIRIDLNIFLFKYF